MSRAMASYGLRISAARFATASATRWRVEERNETTRTAVVRSASRRKTTPTASGHTAACRTTIDPSVPWKKRFNCDAASELGGTCQVENRLQGGVRVAARLPLAPAAHG